MERSSAEGGIEGGVAFFDILNTMGNMILIYGTQAVGRALADFCDYLGLKYDI